MLAWKATGTLQSFRADIPGDPGAFFAIEYDGALRTVNRWRLAIRKHDRILYAGVNGYPTLDAAKVAAQGTLVAAHRVIESIEKDD